MILPAPSTARIGLMIRRRWLIGILCAICGFSSFSARSQTNSGPAVHVENHPPVVSFDIFEPGPDGKIPEHARTPPMYSRVDDNGVPEAHIGATTARHIATISGAASGIDNTDLNAAVTRRRRKTVSNSEKAALEWLTHNYVEISDDAIVWHYTFAHTFNNIVIKSGWPSAFAQADVIKALLLAYKRTFDKHYLDLARRAGYAYSVPCEEGGLRCIVGGVPWFEEVPVPYGYAPMILNGHLYSVVMLSRLLEISNDDRIAELFRVGIASAKRMLLRYDTGYWSIYQQRPRLIDVFLALLPRTTNTVVHSISVSSPVSRPSTLRLGNGEQSTYPGNGIGGPGWGESDAWGRKLIGLAKVTILPGRLSIDHDPIHAGALTVSVEYKSPGCVPPALATYDYRARSKGMAEIPRGSAIGSGQSGCPVQTYPLPAALNQWSQTTAFYHDWHTRLVTELWRITKDPKFYATAVRWGQYAVAEGKLNPETSDGAIAEPIFIPTEAPEDDAEITAALDGKDPAKLSDDEVVGAMRRWIELRCIPHQHAVALLARVGLAAETIRLSSCSEQSKAPIRNVSSINLNLSGTLQTIADAKQPVATVSVGQHLFVTANYYHLSLIDTAAQKVRSLAVDWRLQKRKFVPAGLAFDPESKRLFIANYTGDNILIADLDLAQDKVVIRDELGAGLLVAPEGVAYDGEKRILASAQYDGGSVAVFEADGDAWRLRCTTVVPQAHGIAIAGQYVFATSLVTRELLKINSENCVIEARIGGIGWDAAAGQFMWPTTVQSLSTGMIGVSDAHTGHISVIDPDGLTVHSWFGNNGPGFGAFNMPYGFTENAGHLLVTSTFGNRLIEFTMSGEVLHSYSLESAWPSSYQPDRSKMLGPPAWRNYIESGNEFELFDECIHGGYSTLHTCDQEKIFTLPRPEDRILSDGFYFYFTQIAEVPDGVLVISAQNPVALYITATSKAAAILPVYIGFDSWFDGDKIVRPDSDIAINQLAAKLHTKAQQLLNSVVDSGGLPISEIVKYIAAAEEPVSGTETTSKDALQSASHRVDENGASEIMRHFKDPVGKEFAAASARCAREGCGAERRCEISAPLAKDLKESTSIDLVRLAIASQMNSCLLPTYLNS